MREVAADDPVAVRLIEAMGAEMQARYGDGGLSPAQPQQFLTPGTFLLAELDGIAVGCGGVRPSGENAAEIKRMYVDPAARGRGIARGLLRALVAHARARGLTRLLLETGTAQPEAISLYESEGWTLVPPFGHYADDPRTRCYGLDL
jgi:GNAT superfamily N-acetyltransferase